MAEALRQNQVFRFDQMAVQVKDKVNPAEANVDRYVGLEHIDPESLKIRRWGETSDVESSKIIFKSGDIIFGKRRAYQRKLAVADFDGICSAHAMVLRPKTVVVLEELLPFFMQSDVFMDRAVKISVGGLSPTINWRDLAKEEFALPRLEDQRRIAEVLQANETTLVSLDLLAAKLELARFAHLNHFFKPRFSEGLPLPEVASIASGGTPSKSNPDFWDGELPWASGKDLKVRSLESSELKLTKEGWAVAKTAPAGSTLIVVRGMILAHTFPVTVCAVPMAFNQDLRALIAKEGLVPEYLTLWAEWAGPWFLTRTSESSHGTKRLDSEIFDDALVPRPSIEVQESLIREQDFFLKQKQQLEQRQSKARDCKASLLREIFEVSP